MKQTVRKFLRNTTIGTKILTAFVSVIIIPMIILAFISYSVVSRNIIKEADEKIKMNLTRAMKEYNRRGREMGLGMGQAASGEVIRDIIRKRDRAWAKKTLRRFEEARPYVDFWIITDREAKVIASLNTEAYNDVIEINGLVRMALTTGKQFISSEILNEDFLKREGFNNSYSVAMNAGISSGEYKRGSDQAAENRALAVVVVTPVFDEGRNITGSVITGDILNRDNFLPDEMAGVRSGLITTISMDGMRIATNMAFRDNKPATGSMLPVHMMADINSGRGASGEFEMLGSRHISAFDVIRDNKGNIIGSVDVSMPESSLLSVQRANRNVLGIAALAGLVIALIAASIVTLRITRPIRLIKERADSLAHGNLDAKVDIITTEKTRDEISILAGAFNFMVDRVRDRERERELSLNEMKDKNRELEDLTSRLSDAKEEIEVAFEELQSQSEEMQSTNEELRLLNEDIERKNQELIEANRVIRKSEDELLKARDKLRLIYDTIKDYILLADKELTVVEANRSFAESGGSKESYVIGRILCHLFGVMDPALCPARPASGASDCASDPSSNCPVKRSMRYSIPVSMEMNVGGRILDWYSYPLPHSDLFTDMAVVYIRDITEHKELMQRLIQSDKLSSIGELVSGVAHELNNPLTSIMGYSELLIKDDINEVTRKRAETIHQSSERCRHIVRNLLTFAREHKSEKRLQDINGLIKNTIELKAYRFDVENIAVRLELDASVPMASADGHQLQQVFLNLLNNAEHAIEEKAGPGTITISTAYKDNKVIISFSDTGTGIPQNALPRIFDPFFTTKEVGKGTGLGLSISYGIIKEHGGNIRVSSL